MMKHLFRNLLSLCCLLTAALPIVCNGQERTGTLPPPMLRGALDDVDFSKGVYILNEDWFGHNNSSLSFFTDGGEFVHHIFQKANPGHYLGCTTQYGQIFGSRFFFVSKQFLDGDGIGSRFAVCDKKTMKLQKEFLYIGTVRDKNGKEMLGKDGKPQSVADGRGFLGVDEHKAYIGSSNGVWRYDIDKQTIGLRPIFGTQNPNMKPGQGTGGPGAPDGPDTPGYGNLYHAQIGMMVRVDKRVFAVHQQFGLLVLDARADTLERFIQAPIRGTRKLHNPERDTLDYHGYGSVVLAKDGKLYLSVAQDQTGSGNVAPFLIKVDPYTLDTTRINLPKDIFGPANSWYAWTADGYFGSRHENVLYWNGGPGSWFAKETVYKYDIDKNEGKLIIDLRGTSWKLYGAAIRQNPVNGNLIMLQFQQFGQPIYRIAEYDRDGGLIRIEPLTKHYWFPALPIFPDNEPPVAKPIPDYKGTQYEPLPPLDLTPYASDADNLDAAIWAEVDGITGDKMLDSAYVRFNKLHLVPKDGGNGTCEVGIKFHSNGLVARSKVKVTIKKSTAVEEVSDQPIAHITYTSEGLRCYDLSGYGLHVYDTAGRLVAKAHIADAEELIPLDLPAGHYIVYASNGHERHTAKITITR